MNTNRPPHSCRRRAALHLAGLAVLAGPAGVFAQSIPCPVASDYTVPSDGNDYILSADTCVVTSGTTLTSNGILWNQRPDNFGGTIVNDGTLINNAVLYNGASGVFGTITNFGTLINNGSLTGPPAPPGVFGTVTNAGILVNTGELSAVLNNAGTLTSTGNLGIFGGSNTVGASLYNYNSLGILGSLNNRGTFESFGPSGLVTLNGTLTNSATLINDTGSTLSVNSGSLENVAGATLTNGGTLNNAAEIDNSGTFTITGLTRNNSGFFVNLVGSTLAIQSSGAFFNLAGATLDNFSTLNDSGSLGTLGTIVNGPAAAINIGSSAFLDVDGTLINQGSIHNNGGDVTVEPSEVLANLTGSAYVQTGGDTSLSAGTLNSVPAVQIEGGFLTGDGTVNGNVDNSGGVAFPGTPGETNFETLTVNGNYTQGSAGELEITMDGAAPGEFGVLDVSGLASLDGTLDLFGEPSFTPQAGDDLTFLLFGDLAGAFSNIEFENWMCPTDDTCSVVTGAHSMSLDITANSGGGGTTSVPEPGALALLTIGLAGLFGTRIGRRAVCRARHAEE